LRLAGEIEGTWHVLLITLVMTWEARRRWCRLRTRSEPDGGDGNED
jgi:hypothetical protein